MQQKNFETIIKHNKSGEEDEEQNTLIKIFFCSIFFQLKIKNKYKINFHIILHDSKNLHQQIYN